MKKIASLFNLMLIMFFALSSCTDDREPRYELVSAPKMEVPGGTYILTEPAADFIMETFAWSKGDYNYEAGPTYTLEAAPTDSFPADSTVEMASVNQPYASVTVGQMNAIMKKWDKPADVMAPVYFRVKAGLAISGLQTVIVYSKPIRVDVTPYFMKDPVKAPLYLVGNITEKPWDNKANALGTGLMSMFATDNSTKDEVYTYTGYFASNDPTEPKSFFKFVTIPGSWDPQYGFASDGKLSAKGENIPGGANGYKTLTVDLKALTYKLEDYDITGKEPMTGLGLVGDFTGWADGADVALEPLPYDPFILRATITLAEDGGLKVRQNGSWDNNWGGATVPFGKLTKGGDNISLTAGKYYIQVNTLTMNTVIIAM